MSPIHEPQVAVVPKVETEFENHADILVQIDTIDGDIQKCEELLRAHRLQKEEKLLHRVVEQIVVDEIQAQPETLDMEVEVDQIDNTTNDVAEPMEEPMLVEPEPKDEQQTHQVLNGPAGEDIEMESVEPEIVQQTVPPKFSLLDIMKPVDVDDPFYKRKGQQTRRPQLFDQIYAENNSRAKKYGRVHLAIAPVRNTDQDEDLGRHHHHHRHLNGKPEVFKSVEDYPFYQENINRHDRLRSAMLKNMAAKAVALDEKELNLKREYKQHWEIWTKKVEKLDKQKEKMSSAPAPTTREEDQVGETPVFTTRNRRGAYTSDAVRSEAELLEIIQSLENADMRNPDVRASRTAATVPPMILDPYVREHVHYYDYNHLVTDPAKYYRLGPVTDVWSETEREIFTKRYLNYPKQFGKIAAGIEGKTASQCVLFYYREKKKIGFKDMLSNRGRKRKNNGGKRKEKAIQPPSPTGQPGKKHKGSALIEDIGQANRTKQAKTKELRELQESNQVLKGFEVEPGSRRRVRSGAQQGGTPGLEDTSNAASPAPSSTVSTPVISSERRKQKPKGNTRGSKTSAAAAAAAAAAEETPEKKPKVERSSPAVGGSTKAAKQEEPLISVDSPGTTPTPTKAVIPEVEATEMAAVAPTTATGTASARWTGPEHEKAIEALKKYGRDFEAVAAAVGTKTVDQCRNFCFNYKRKFGVSALDDANNLRSTLPEDGDVKEGTTAEKSKARKTKAGAAPNSVDSSSGATGKDGVGTATATGRKRTTKPALPVVPESEKDEPMLDTPEAETTEDPDASVPKSRRKRTASRSEAGNADAPATGTSFRALYSREPPSASNSPALSSFSPTDSGQFSGQSNAEGVVRRPNFSSYWSRQERLDFVRLLSQYGKDWDRIAKALKTKTQIQVRNHFSNNADKLIAEGVVGIDVVGTSAQDQGEAGDDTSRASFRGNYSHEYPAQYESVPDQSGGPGPRPGYFMPPSTNNGPDASVPAQRETRSMTPPRRATNIGNLLNNNDEDVHVAVEDWFGNSEESGSQDAEDEMPENEGQMPVSKPRDIPNDLRFNEARRRDMDEDVETEDELDRPQTQEMQKAGVRGYPSIIGQRRMSEGAPIPHHYPANPSASDYYGRHPQAGQHPQVPSNITYQATFLRLRTCMLPMVPIASLRQPLFRTTRLMEQRYFHLRSQYQGLRRQICPQDPVIMDTVRRLNNTLQGMAITRTNNHLNNIMVMLNTREGCHLRPQPCLIMHVLTRLDLLHTIPPHPLVGTRMDPRPLERRDIRQQTYNTP
ncbi:hypothetical protein BG003_011943 [Podila horticola]|nr:hypothetical protein BG003_011943 [Podila horticola]